MTIRFLIDRIGFALILSLFISGSAMAQEAIDRSPTIALQIDGLTSADRDALQLELSGRGDLRIVFACVPAGILVLQGTSDEAPARTKQRAIPVLRSRIGEKNISETEHDLAWAERTCAQMRDR